MGGLARSKAEEVARTSYGRLVAVLASRFRDIEIAEEALAEAFRRALEIWPVRGVPDNPEAWLLTVSHNQIVDTHRSAASRYSQPLGRQAFEQIAMAEIDKDEYGDKQLGLLFVCTHPAIASNIHAPLMLQTVFGFDADRIATAFMLPGPTLSQRLVRAKRKIRDAGIPFSVPDRSEIGSRLEGVLEAIYGAYSLEWSNPESPESPEDMALEAVYLADLLVALMPEEAEVLGLAALLHYSFARRQARFDPAGNFIPLEEQEVSQWDRMHMRRADILLQRAQKQNQLGRFQLEAAIQSVHGERMETGVTQWRAIAELYEGLVQIAPTAGAIVGKAAAFGRAFGNREGLAVLAQLEPDSVQRFQPYWATRAHLLEGEQDFSGAVSSLKKAISITTELPVRRYLQGKLESLNKYTSGGLQLGTNS